MAVSPWSGFWNELGDAVPYALLVDSSSFRRKIGKHLRRRAGRELGEKLTTLLDDATPASTAAVTTPQITHTPTPGGLGVGATTTIETRSVLASGAVTAADVTSLKLFLEGGAEQDSQPTYPTDASGNGGGGKVGW